MKIQELLEQKDFVEWAQQCTYRVPLDNYLGRRSSYHPDLTCPDHGVFLVGDKITDEGVVQHWEAFHGAAANNPHLQCVEKLELGDDFGDNSITFHCQLVGGHGGSHQESFNTHGAIVRVQWGGFLT